VTIYTGIYGNGAAKIGEARSATCLTRPNFGEARTSVRQCLNGSAAPATPCYSAVHAMGLCLSVCLSVTSRSSTKTDRHRHRMTLLLKLNRKSYALNRMIALPMTLSDPWALTAPISTFCIAFHIFVMGVVRNYEITCVLLNVTNINDLD